MPWLQLKQLQLTWQLGVQQLLACHELAGQVHVVVLEVVGEAVDESGVEEHPGNPVGFQTGDQECHSQQ